jgi:hypothetical protein
VAVTLALWLALVFALGATGALLGRPGAPPLAMSVAVVAPLLVFVAGYRLSVAFRGFVLALDLRVLTAIHGWRFAGLAFIALATFSVLPGVFAWPAGLGDMAMGLTAPWLVWALLRHPAAALGRRLVTWNLLGMLDLVVAVGLGTFSAMAATGMPGEVTTVPMAQLPLVLIPAYVVPLLFMLHLAALWKLRRRA